MRVLVAVSLVIGFGMLWLSSHTGTVGWAWAAVVLSTAAVAALIIDWRRKSTTADTTIAETEHAPAQLAEGTSEWSAAESSATVGLLVPGAGERSPGVESRSNGSGPERPESVSVDTTGTADANGPTDATGLTGTSDGSGVGDDVESDGGVPAGPTASSQGSGTESARAGGEVSPAAGDAGVALAPETVSSSGEKSRADTSGSGGGYAGAPSSAAGWFSPRTDPGEVPGESGGGPAAPVWQWPGGSDPTVVFARVPGDGLGGDGADSSAGAGASEFPGEEHADESALAVVASLDDEVVVVDEQPRYHLAGCDSLGGRATIGLAVREAVELEFTPCEVCSPVRELSAAAARSPLADQPDEPLPSRA